jgi:hypothetical protein
MTSDKQARLRAAIVAVRDCADTMEAQAAGLLKALPTAVKRLSAMDATMMAAVAALTDVVDQLESAAERDAQYERAFVLVIETTGVLLQALENARAATEALGSARP